MPHTHCPALLAIELAEPLGARPIELPTEAAASLVDAVATDFLRLLPGADAMGLALAAALFDPAQILRPGWPVFAELALLYRRERRGAEAPAVMSFGTVAGRMASPLLEPEPGLGRGAFVLVPLVLVGDEATAAAIGARMEADFNDKGLAGAAVALFLDHALGLKVAHARYLTHNDLCALTALQLDHVGLGEAWLLLEAALLDPSRRCDIVAPGGWPWCYRDASIRHARFGFEAWASGPGAALAPAERGPAFLAALAVQRQLGALYTAHGLPPVCEPDGAALLPQAAALDEVAAPSAGATRALIGRTAPGLGLMALSVIERTDAGACALAHAYPLAPDALSSLIALLAERYDVAPEITRREPFAVDATGRVVLGPQSNSN
jgi:hypothetical protein